MCACVVIIVDDFMLQEQRIPTACRPIFHPSVAILLHMPLGQMSVVYTNQLYYCYIKYFQLKEKTKCLNMAPILSTSFLLPSMNCDTCTCTCTRFLSLICKRNICKQCHMTIFKNN